jgi:hypothetical protein
MRLPRHLLADRPWRSRAGRLRHRRLDEAGWAALDRDRDPGRVPTQAELEGLVMSYDRERKARVLLMEVEKRTSERTGRPWYSAWLGRARVIGFEADQSNERGHKVIRLFVEEPEPRDGPPKPPGKPPERDPGPGRGHQSQTRAAGAAPGDSGRPYRRESEAARRERVGAETARRYGVEADPDDPLPF